MQPALELQAVSKRFGATLAVDGVDLEIQRGDFVGLLGRNGAGKSTLLNMVSGLLRPTSGSIRVLGHDVVQEPLAVKRQIGVMPETGGLLDDLTGEQYLRFVGRIYGLADATIAERTRELFGALELAPSPGSLIAEYSTGMRKKVALCGALLHSPQAILLDEPFEAVDPASARTIQGIVEQIRRSGVTVILTTHILEIVERLCPRVAILHRGRLLAFGKVGELGRPGSGEDLESLFLGLTGGSRSAELSWF